MEMTLEFRVRSEINAGWEGKMTEQKKTQKKQNKKNARKHMYISIKDERFTALPIQHRIDTDYCKNPPKV